MAEPFFNKISKPKLCLLHLVLVGNVSLVCGTFSAFIGFKVMVFMLLITMSFLAAVLFALILNFNFISSLFSFVIKSTEELVLFVVILKIASMDAVQTQMIRQVSKNGRKGENKDFNDCLYNYLLLLCNSVKIRVMAEIEIFVFDDELLTRKLFCNRLV